MDIFVINMPHRKLRKQAMETLINQIGFQNVTFVEPVKVTKVPSEYKHLSPGYLSLNLTVKDKIFKQAKSNVFLVLEDDVMAMINPHEVIPKLQEALKALPDDWDMLYLEYCMEQCWATKNVKNNVYKASKPYCTAAIIYRKASIPKITQCLETEKLMIDMSYVNCINKSINAYVVMPPIFAQNQKLQGDLDHLNSPFKIQYWLNIILKMYGSSSKDYPRLPACISFKEILPYIRWFNVFIIVLVIVYIYLVLARL